jgi:pSer/pThr/pTyr-binding forkhead associated (FHA) protein
MLGRADPEEGYVPAIDLGPYGAHDAGVSRRHAVLFSAEGGLYIRDLGSTNGTRINGFDLEPNQAYKLHEGDRLEFGHVKTQFHVVGSSEPHHF